MNGFDDERFEFSATFEAKEELLAAVRRAGLSRDLENTISSELDETDDKDSNVIFVSSDGDVVYKAIWAPPSALNGERGPEIFPGASNDVVIAVYNRDFIDQIVMETEAEEAGLRDDMWEQRIGELVDEVASCYHDRPSTWGEFE
jgi:hypothetical protein